MLETDLRSWLERDLHDVAPSSDRWFQVAAALEPNRGRASLGRWIGRRTLALAAAAVGVTTGISIVAAVSSGPPATHALLGPAPSGARSAATPQTVSNGDTTFKWTFVRTSPTTLEFTWTVSGSAVYRWHTLADPYEASNQPMPAEVGCQAGELRADYFAPKVTDSSGAALPITFGMTFPAGAPGEGAARVQISGPGQYRVQFGRGPVQTLTVS